jgi:Na+-transporting NADH:ubiquinone oxidoreductase subunit B
VRKLFDELRPKVRQYGDYPAWRATFELLDRFLYSSPATTTGTVHVRDTNSVQRLMNNFVIASLPCWLIGLWNTGEQATSALQATGIEMLPGWRGELIYRLGIASDPANIGACVFIGLLYFVPVFVTALATGAFWEILFAQKRQRAVDEGLLAVAWIFCLILPATVHVPAVILGMTFATVVGKAIFGGTGRYLISPSLLGICFVVFSYPDLVFGPESWIPVPGYDEATTIELVADNGVDALFAAGYSWSQLFIGNQPGPMGAMSVLGCVLGAAYLLVTGNASWRIMAGSVAGMLAAVAVVTLLGGETPISGVPWYWHLVIGGWAFGTVFLATDPVAAAVTEAGRWGFGILVGVLTIVVRVTNPYHYQDVFFAILFACIFSPLIDYVVVERNIRRRIARQETRDG